MRWIALSSLWTTEARLPNDCDAISGHCFVGNKREKRLGNLLLSVALYGIVRHLKWNFSFSGRQNKEKKNRYWNFLLSLIMTLCRFYQANKKKNKNRPNLVKASWLLGNLVTRNRPDTKDNQTQRILSIIFWTHFLQCCVFWYVFNVISWATR